MRSLFVGIGASIITLYFKGWRSQHCELGNIAGTNLYLDLSTHHRAMQIPHIRIYRHIGPINFALGNSFKSSLYHLMDITSIRLSKKLVRETIGEIEHAPDRDSLSTRWIIIDISGVSHVDMAGVNIICNIDGELKLLGVHLILSGPNDSVFEVFKHAELHFGTVKLMVVPSVHDAVLLAKNEL